MKTWWIRTLQVSELGCGIAILGMAFAVCYEILSRWLFDQPTIWAQEISVYLLIALAFLGLAGTHQADEHIRIDLVTRSLGRRLQRAIGIVGLVLLLGYACVAAHGGLEMVAQSWKFGRRSLTLLAVPVWIPELVVPVGMGLLAISALLRLVAELQAPNGERTDD